MLHFNHSPTHHYSYLCFNFQQQLEQGRGVSFQILEMGRVCTNNFSWFDARSNQISTFSILNLVMTFFSIVGWFLMVNSSSMYSEVVYEEDEDEVLF